MVARAEVLARRRRRTFELTKEGLDERVRAGLRQVWEAGRKPEVIRVRPVFIRLPQPVTADGERRKLAAARLLRSRGVALRFYLLALFEAQCRRRSGLGAGSKMRLHHGDGAISWVDLVAVDTEGDRRTKERRTRLDNRVRQVKGALDTLHAEGMVEVPRVDGVRRSAEFVLMHETGRGDLASPRTYTLPKANEATVDVPVPFFLNGWVHVLQPSEIAAWLMFRDLAWRFPGVHAEDGVYVFGDTREDEYDLSRYVYEGHAMLRALGLLQYGPKFKQDADGNSTVRMPSRYDPHRFQLRDDGLSQLAVPTARSVIDKQRSLHSDPNAEVVVRHGL